MRVNITATNAAALEAPTVVYNCAPEFFQHSDLLQELFEYFNKDHYTTPDRTDLLGFMRISKSTFHYAARILWSRIGNRFAFALGSLLDVDKWDNNLNRNLVGKPLLM